MKNKDLAITSSNINKIYNTYDDRVVSFMKYIVYDLEEQYDVIPLSFKVNFDLLANILSIYYKAVDNISNAQKSIEKQRYYTQIMTCTKTINQICAGLGCDPLMKAKINKLNKRSSEEDAQALMDELLV